MKRLLITSEMAVAFHHCERKAYPMLMDSPESGENLYPSMMEQARSMCRRELTAQVRQKYPDARRCTPELLVKRLRPVLDACLENDDLIAKADSLVPTRKQAGETPATFEAVIATPHHKVIPCEKLRLGFVSSVLGTRQGVLPQAGSIFTPDGRFHRTKLYSIYPSVRKTIQVLRNWQDEEAAGEPPVILNRHCAECPFQARCWEIAIRDDNLTLLKGLRPKKVDQLHKKGIFTVTQLSYQFRPRKTRSAGRKPPLYRPELQALAIRTGKTFLVEMPDLDRAPVEIFLDIEGIPDRKFQYLAGLLVVSENGSTPYSFWANTPDEEAKVWEGILEVVHRFPDAPVFHYGQYEAKACKLLAERHGGTDLAGRLVNVLSAVYGKVYFPAYGNGLKELGACLGIEWSSRLDSGLMTLVWRQRWEWTGDDEFRRELRRYNARDCEALQILTDRLTDMRRSVETEPSLDFADRPKKQSTTGGEKLHQHFNEILLLGHANYSEKRIAFTRKKLIQPDKGPTRQKRNIKPPKPTRTVSVAPLRKCPKCKTSMISVISRTGEATVVDLVFTGNGCRKSITRYVGPMIRCRVCTTRFSPRRVRALRGKKYGDGLIAYIAHQRMVLRMPLRSIASSLDEVFGLKLTSQCAHNLIKELALRHVLTERRIMNQLLDATCIHCDETKVNIQGESHFVWVMTDGKHVSFHSTPSREAKWLNDVLSDFKGILVTDFYAGYDSFECRQQKCLSHLTRDMNEDLWRDPFNLEYERFAEQFKILIVPIMETIQKYGSRKRNLNKHRREVESFYRKYVDGAEYAHETTRKYQKRFQRYRDSLFTFLTEDDIPWNNNMAERALRHLAIQRKISGSFGKEGIHRYLRLLSVSQTCRFQEKSFLKFLISGDKDVDAFDVSKRKKS